MKALIIEDEVMAAQALQKLLGEVSPETEVISVLESIEDTVEWLRENPMPDLMFMDIHLADGASFAIFEQVDVTCPVIFTTAYDEYALKAFEVNSIDYLLKPIDKEALKRAMHKFYNLQGKLPNLANFDALIEQLTNKKKYRSCFLLPERDKLVPLPVSNIAYVYIDAKTIKMISLDHKTYYLTERIPANGYATAETIEFTIEKIRKGGKKILLRYAAEKTKTARIYTQYRNTWRNCAAGHVKHSAVTAYGKRHVGGLN